MVAYSPLIRLSREPALVAARPVPLKARQAIRLQILQDAIGARRTLSAALTPCDCVALGTEVAFLHWCEKGMHSMRSFGLQILPDRAGCNSRPSAFPLGSISCCIDVTCFPTYISHV